MLSKRSDPVTPVLGDLRTEIDRVFEQFFEGKWPAFFDTGAPGAWMPALDIAEKGDAVTVRAEVPGVDPEQIELTVDDDELTIRGSKDETHEEKDKNFFRSERRFGSFYRRVKLPAAVDPGKVTATSKDGVLRIDLIKNKAAQPKRIPVTVAKH